MKNKLGWVSALGRPYVIWSEKQLTFVEKKCLYPDAISQFYTLDFLIYLPHKSVKLSELDAK